VSGGGRWGAEGEHLDTHSSAMPSVRYAIRISLVPHAVLLMPLRGHTGHEIHLRGLKNVGKSHL